MSLHCQPTRRLHSPLGPKSRKSLPKVVDFFPSFVWWHMGTLLSSPSFYSHLGQARRGLTMTNFLAVFFPSFWVYAAPKYVKQGKSQMTNRTCFTPRFPGSPSPVAPESPQKVSRAICKDPSDTILGLSDSSGDFLEGPSGRRPFRGFSQKRLKSDPKS